MSGDSLNNDDDFLDDPSNEEDFVIEDIVGKNDDLEDLFDTPAGADEADGEAVSPDESGAAATESAMPDEESAEEELLFTDHTEGINPSEEFAKPQFAESGETDWQGDNLDLESVGVPASSIENEEQLADPQIDEAKESFAAELDSLLEDEQDFGLDVEDELELVDRSSEVDDGISEFEQSGPFVIDDGEGLWSEDDEQEAAVGEAAVNEDSDDFALADPVAASADLGAAADLGDGEAATEPNPVDVLGMAEHLAASGLEGVEGTEEFELGTALSQDGVGPEAGEEAGWEPLPTQSVDELSEVGEVQRADEGEGEYEGEYYEGAVVGEAEGGEEGDYDESGYDDSDYDESGYEDDAAYEDESQATEAVPAGAAWSNKPEDLDEVDGHDIYSEDGGSRRDYVVGAGSPNRRGLGSVLLSLAATLLIVLGVGAVVVRPEWFGLRVDPERVVKVEIARPQVDLTVFEPPVVGVATPAGEGAPDASAGTTKQVDTGDLNPPDPSMDAGDGSPEAATPPGQLPATEQPNSPDAVDPKAVDPNTVDPNTVDPNTVDPNTVAGDPGVEGAPDAGNPATGNPATRNPATENPATGNPATGNPATGNPENGGVASGTGSEPAEGQTTEMPPGGAKPADPQAAVPAQPVTVTPVGQPEVSSSPDGGSTGANPAGPAPSDEGKTGGQAWPVASTTPDTPLPTKDKDAELTRFGDGLLVGDLTAKKGQAGAMNGVMPGSRAFAQLHNGNYFIGQVKQVAETTITLRVEAGEVTLATVDIAQLTPLGSADYDQLQKATKGFVRLTNNNRLVGGILSRIADDHVVLEFRSNRVMLPKSAIGEIVSDDQDQSKVRLDTTTEEDSWLRAMVGRKLGTGQGGSGAESQAPASAGTPKAGSGGGQLQR